MTANYIFGLILKSAISHWRPFQPLLGWLLSSKILKITWAKANIWALLVHLSQAIPKASVWVAGTTRWAYLSITVRLTVKMPLSRLIRSLVVPNRPVMAGVC